MNWDLLLPAVTSLLALIFAAALFDQWLERRHTFQLVWAIGMLFFAIASGSEALAAALGWNELLYRTWYLTGAVWTAGWLGLGTAFLLGRTRFGYAFALCLFLAGPVHVPGPQPARVRRSRRAALPLLRRGRGARARGRGRDVLPERALADARGDGRGWRHAAEHRADAADHAAAAGYALHPDTGMPVGTLFPPQLRLLTPFLNVTGAFALILGAIFSAYVFMPKRRVLAYSLDPNQTGDQFLFNLLIAPVAIAVNLVASLPGAFRALLTGRIHSRVPATLLIAIGAFIPTITDSLNRFGSTELFQLGKFLGVVFLFLGFLVSVEVFREFRVPFTRIRLWRRDEEAGPGGTGHRRRNRAEQGVATGSGAEPRAPAPAPPRGARLATSVRHRTSAAGASRPSGRGACIACNGSGAWRPFSAARRRPRVEASTAQSGLRTVAWADVRGTWRWPRPHRFARGIGAGIDAPRGPLSGHSSRRGTGHGLGALDRLTARTLTRPMCLRQPMWPHGPRPSVHRPKADSRLAARRGDDAAVPARRRGRRGVPRATPRRPSARPRTRQRCAGRRSARCG